MLFSTILFSSLPGLHLTSCKNTIHWCGLFLTVSVIHSIYLTSLCVYEQVWIKTLLFFIIFQCSFLTSKKNSSLFLLTVMKGYLEQGILLKDRKRLALCYVKSRTFILDTLSILPFELVAKFFYQTGPVFRFNRLFRIDRVLECRFKIETRTRFPFIFRIIYLIFLILIIMHWNGCLYYFLSKHIG